jgi:hypothetical protein
MAVVVRKYGFRRALEIGVVLIPAGPTSSLQLLANDRQDENAIMYSSFVRSLPLTHYLVGLWIESDSSR